MKNYRKYGRPPFKVALIHGGPGAIGEMAPLAQELEPIMGVLEPLQTATTLIGQVDELHNVLKAQADLPVTLVGFSWGAWLSYILAARFEEMVSKLILVGSGPFEPQYVSMIGETRLSRLTSEQKLEYSQIIRALNDPLDENNLEKFNRLGQLVQAADQFDPFELVQPDRQPQGNPYYQVLKQAQEMRADGRLIAMAEQIQVPVTAIHGVYDPHPAEGVCKPLSSRIKEFKFITLEKCGHKPWIERQAKDRFLSLLKDELVE